MTSFWNQMTCAHEVLLCKFALYLFQISASTLVWFCMVQVLGLLAGNLEQPVSHMSSMLCQLPRNTSHRLKQVVMIGSLGEYVVPKLGICPILRLGKPNLESAMLPNLKMGQHNLKIGLPNLKIGLPKLGILLDL